MLGLLILISHRAWLNLTRWTRLTVLEDRLIVRQYDRAVRFEQQWDRRGILSVQAVRAPRHWNLRRPTSLQIELTGKMMATFMQEQPFDRIARVAGLIRARLQL